MTTSTPPIADLVDHPADCACCSPADPLDTPMWDETQRVSAGIVAGAMIVLLICALLDLATGNRVVAGMLELRS